MVGHAYVDRRRALHHVNVQKVHIVKRAYVKIEAGLWWL